MNAKLWQCRQLVVRPWILGMGILGLACICSARAAYSQQLHNPLRSGVEVRQASHQSAEPQKKIDSSLAKPAPKTTSSPPTASSSPVIPVNSSGPNLGNPRPVRTASRESVLVVPPYVASRNQPAPGGEENGTKSVLPPNGARVPHSAGENIAPSRPNVSPAPHTGMPMHHGHAHQPRMVDAIGDGMVVEGDAYPEIVSEGCGMDGGCGLDSCNSCCLIPCPFFSWETLQVFGGVQGFTGPANRGETASFGFNEGINWGTPLACFPELASVQLGARAAQSNLSAGDSTTENRNQIFVTAGLFRRVDWGIQGGAVIDYLSDDWYYNIDLIQIRSELSWVFPCSHEIGFWFTGGLNSSDSVSNLDQQGVRLNERWEPTDLYAFFYRHRFDECVLTEGRFYAGFTGESDGLIGADLRMPLNDRVAVASGFTYLIPNEGEGAGVNFGHAQESWNLGINLVWYPGCGGSRSSNYSRPLFDVADNGSFMFDRDN